MSATVPRETSAPKPPWAAAVVLLGATAFALINATVANVAIPAIQRDLGLTSAGVSWTLAGWALTYALALVPAGQLGDRFGHRRIFTIGIALFMVTSLVAALAQDEAQLVVARLVQGAAGGLFYPAIAALLSALFTGRARGRVFGAMGATVGAAAAVGPIVGGILLQLLGDDLGWRAIFALNVPLGAVILVGGLAKLPKTRFGAHDTRFDGVGFALLTLGLTGALIPLIIGENVGWPLWIWLLLAVGLVVLGCFVGWERRAEHRGRATIIVPSMFRHRDFSICVTLGLLQFAGFISIFYVLALLWQTGLDRSALEMGLLTLPEALASIAGASLISPFMQRFGSRRTVIIGTVMLTTGIALVPIVLLVVPPSQLIVAWLILPLVITGMGGGLSISATLNHAMSTIDRSHSGSASGVIATVQRVGNAVGLAAIGGVFFAVLAAGAPTGTAESYVGAATVALATCAAVVAVGAVLSFFLRRPATGARR